MSDWLREVEHAGYSVQYAGLDSETSPLLAREAANANAKCVRIFWVLFLTILFCAGLGIGCYLIIEEDRDYPVTKPYILINRTGWRAQNSQPDPGYPALVSRVAITQTSTDECDTLSDCSRIIRDIQRRHVNQENLTDIAYNFLVAGDGATYEGRGWERQPGGRGQEEKTLVVAFIGNFDYVLPPKIQIEEFKVLLREGVKRGVIDPCFTISLYKERPQDGGGQLVHVFNRLVFENNKRKAQIKKCS